MFEGNAVSLLYYGLGNSGKEFSMSGTPSDIGSIPRAFSQVMETAATVAARAEVLVCCSLFLCVFFSVSIFSVLFLVCMGLCFHHRVSALL